MKGLLLRIFMLTVALGAIEAVAYWWMHQAPAGEGEPVLTYRPPENAEARNDKEDPTQSSSSSDQQSSIDNHQSALSSSPTDHSLPISASQHFSLSASTHRSLPTDHSLPISASQHFSISAFTYTPLPDLVARSIPSLYCTTGSAYRIDFKGGVTVHCAFFEWDQATSRNVLEAYKHLPEQCMGSNGMTLTAKYPPRAYVVRQHELAPEQSSSSSSSNHQSSISSSPTDHRSLPTDHSHSESPPLSSSAHRSLITDHSITDHSISFDHTVFRDPGGVVVHAFKGTWVSGASNLLGDGLRGGEEQWRQLRWKAALNRFRPAHARVVQGAIRGIPDANGAWQAFEQAILKDLTFAPALR